MAKPRLRLQISFTSYSKQKKLRDPENELILENIDISANLAAKSDGQELLQP